MLKAESSKLIGKNRGSISTGGFDRVNRIIAGKMRQVSDDKDPGRIFDF
jgi:hypothetical protein